MLAAIYARVSTQRQEKEETIQSQLEVLRSFAKENGHTIVREYIDDGWSGDILARPELDKLRDDAPKKLWEAVLIYDPDRLARRYSFQELVLDELKELGLQVLFVTIPPVKTDEDKILNGVRGLFAEYERLKIAERMRRGKLHKAREGHVVTSQAPFGYTYIPKQGDKDGYYKVNEQEAEIVKMVFNWVGVQGLTVRQVIKRLHEMGVRPKRSERGVWNTSTLTTLLRREDYVGRAFYNRSLAVVPERPLNHEKYKRIKKTSRRWKPVEDWITIPVPAIIDKELFNKTRAQLKANFELCKRNRKNDYLLAGHIYCTCGRKRAGEGPQRGKHLYYRCTDRVYSFPLEPSCKEYGVNARIADQFVWDRVTKFMTSPELIRKQMLRWVSQKAERKNETNRSVEQFGYELDKIKKEEQRYIKIYGAGLITLEQFEEAISDLKSRRVALEQQIGYLSNQQKEISYNFPSLEMVSEFVSRAAGVLNGMNFENKKEIVGRYVEKVVASQQEMIVYGCLTLGKEVELCAESRDSWTPKRGKIDVV